MLPTMLRISRVFGSRHQPEQIARLGVVVEPAAMILARHGACYGHRPLDVVLRPAWARRSCSARNSPRAALAVKPHCAILVVGMDGALRLVPRQGIVIYPQAVACASG